ncbi:Cupin 1 [Corchorus olitorius]|uniref:Cupin 1 n=1 Tax=Corchorus olitorius TaxID=93759 RepID=A0A1R3I403_9ROSI|nr:Cupin 1 [Corchorus olitorius]
MGKGVRFLVLALALVVCYAVTVTMGFRKETEWEREGGHRHRHEEEGSFLLPDSKPVMSSDAGEMRVVQSVSSRIIEKPLHIGFITMEPNTLFIPHYLDSTLILFFRTGEARVGCIFKDEMVERRLKIRDVFMIPAGSTFYILNPGEGQRLHMICSIDPSDSLQLGTFQGLALKLSQQP